MNIGFLLIATAQSGKLPDLAERAEALGRSRLLRVL